MSLGLIHKDWTVASTLTDDEQTSVKITSKTIHHKQMPHDRSHDILPYTPHNMDTEGPLESFNKKTIS